MRKLILNYEELVCAPDGSAIRRCQMITMREDQTIGDLIEKMKEQDDGYTRRSNMRVIGVATE